MPQGRLTQGRVDALKTRQKILDVRDSVIRGFGVRILPSGRKRYFLHNQVDGKRVWQSIGDARVMTLECARERATFLLVSRSRHDEASSDISTSLAFDDVANEVFRSYGRHWKPRTLEVNLGYYRNQILVWFKGRAIGDITRHDVQRWFVSLHATPVAADRSASVLSVILRQAEVYGHRPEGSHPCTGIKRYRRRHRERFLNDNEIGRPSRVLDDKCEKRPLMAAIERILHLTGCRKSEILTLKWSDYREGRLCLRGSKTGRRTDWLSLPAHRILDALP